MPNGRFVSLQQAKDAHLRARPALLKHDNVIGVGFGMREREGRITQEPVIVVLVSEKIPPLALRKEQLLPAAIEGVGVDVRKARLTERDHLEHLERNRIRPEEAECNLDHLFVDHGKLHELNLRRPDREEAPKDLATAVFGEIFVIENDGTLANADDEIDHVAAYNAFRAQFGDDYDFVLFHYDTGSGFPGPGNSSPTIHNTVAGINHYRGDSYNGRAAWGSTRLQSVQFITGLQTRRILHETAHRWCSYVNHKEGGTFSDALHKEISNPDQVAYHWGSWFDDDNSCMDYDYYDWVDSNLVAGELQKDQLTSGNPAVDEFSYHPLDLYLMGLMSAGEVGTFRYIRTPADPDGNGSFAGTIVSLTASNVVDEEGARNPAYPDTQRVLHQAWVLITNNLSGIGTLSSGALGALETYRSGHVERFRRATRGRGVLDASLLHSNHAALHIRDNTNDSGGGASTGAFWNSPDIWVRNDDDAGSDDQPAIRQQDNYLRARVWNSSATAYDDVTVRFYRANWAGTEFLFPDDWHPDSLIGEATISVPANGSAIAKVTWPAALVPDDSWAHPCLLAEVIPLDVDPAGRHHVWDNPKLGQRNISVIDPPPPGDWGEIEFAFGHAERLDKYAILSIVRSADLPGLALTLDAAGLDIGLERDRKVLPRVEFLVDAGDDLDVDRGTGRVIEMPERTGVPRAKQGVRGIAEKVGVKPVVEALREIPGLTGKTRPALERVDGDKGPVYRLPQERLVGLRVPMHQGRVMMRLRADLTRVPKDARGGIVRIIQSDARGMVVGGADVLIRPSPRE